MALPTYFDRYAAACRASSSDVDPTGKIAEQLDMDEPEAPGSVNQRSTDVLPHSKVHVQSVSRLVPLRDPDVWERRTAECSSQVDEEPCYIGPKPTQGHGIPPRHKSAFPVD